MLVMSHNLEIIGNFMQAQNGYLPLLVLLWSGQFDDMSPITPKVLSLPDLTRAMEYAGNADSLETVVVTSMNGTE
jgi:alcohol dehydrogenase